MTAKRAKSSKPRQRYVWRISRYRDRFEMPENLRKQRKQPLDFTRSFVRSNAGMMAAKCQEQMRVLGNGDGMRRSALKGLFEDLKEQASDLDRPYRGYLIDADYRPRTLGQIAKLVEWPTAELQKAMKELASAGLIERVPEPDYVADDEREFPPEAPEEPQNKRRRKSTERGGKSGSPSRTGNGRDKSLPKNNGSEPRGLAAAPKEQPEGQPQAAIETPRTPTTTPVSEPVPDHPNEPEVRQGREMSHSGPARPVKSRSAPDAVPIGHVVKIRDFEADGFGLEVFEALGLGKRYSPQSKEGKSEWKSFANWFVKAKASSPPSAWPEIRERGLAKAKHIGTKGKSARSPGAVWHRVMSGPAAQAKAEGA